ncbi:uncharacterized protein LOC128956876 [Oppia nitens]|uniref:uncharacterized protein LOC128956876 n=1 Tax=Oppia nitens TaxID=1686743 RepID=UPI0023DC7CE1|nr:uncharacterized protein LOC128956876 [Oppia nitens]
MSLSSTPIVIGGGNDSNNSSREADPEVRQVLLEIIDKVADDDVAHETAVGQVMSDMVDTVAEANNNDNEDYMQWMYRHRPLLTASRSRRPRRRDRWQTMATVGYRPPAQPTPVVPPVVDRSRSLQDITSDDEPQLSLYDEKAGAGPPPHLFMSSLYGHTGTGGSHITGELFQRTTPFNGNTNNTNIGSLSDSDYQLLINELEYYGFHLDRTVIGRGGFGSVVTGTYGPNISNLMKIEAVYLNGGSAAPGPPTTTGSVGSGSGGGASGGGPTGIQVGQKFAAKYIHLIPSSNSLHRSLVYLEKLVMKEIRHRNCVSYRMAINLGPRKLCTYGCDQYYSYEHTMLIMDWADQGDLEQFIHYHLRTGSNQYNVGTCIRFMRDLLAGVRYLHGKSITHGDIYACNVLIFSRQVPVRVEIPFVAKLSDFGLAQIRQLASSGGQPYLTDQQHRDSLRTDMEQLYKLFMFTMIKQSHPQAMWLPELEPWCQLALDLNRNWDIRVIFQRYAQLIGWCP